MEALDQGLNGLQIGTSRALVYRLHRDPSFISARINLIELMRIDLLLVMWNNRGLLIILGGFGYSKQKLHHIWIDS